MATDPKNAGVNAVNQVFGNFGGQAPEGMSQLFWNEINNSPEAEAIRRSKKNKIGQDMKSDADVRREIDRLIAQKWAATPPEKQQQYQHQDQIGSKNIPGSPAWQAEQHEVTARKNADISQADFSKWQEGPQADLEETARKAAEGDKAAIDRLTNLVNSIEDPAIKEYVGDYVSQAANAGPSQEAMARQRAEYDKAHSLEDPTMTAAERLMQYEARQKQEQDLRSQRGALENQMQARGLYGSGAELQMNLAAQQEMAQRRAYDEMLAQANAQNRSMEALKQAGELATSMRESEAQESQFRGAAADKASEFNKTLRDAYDKWVNEQKRKLNEDKVTRETGLANTTLTANAAGVNRAGTVANTALGGVQTGAALRDSGLKTEIDTHRNVRDEEILQEGAKL